MAHSFPDPGVHGHLMASVEPVAQGKVFVGASTMQHNDRDMVGVQVDASSKRLRAVADSLVPMSVKVMMLSHEPTYIEGEPFYWVCLQASGLDKMFVRESLVTGDLELTSLLDASARLLCQW